MHRFHISLILILLTGISCSVSKDLVFTDYEPVRKEKCVIKPNLIYVFNQSDSLPFSIDTIGYVYVETINEKAVNILNRIQYEAWDNCANAIGAVPDYLTDENMAFNMQTVQLTIPALRIISTKDFIEVEENYQKYDTAFVRIAKQQIKDQESRLQAVKNTENTIGEGISLIRTISSYIE
ncbi:hypothetical protein OO013_18500 [Mangrovivirga sp. M17]|uniref:Uncharacterized protein n=1 Tax=Mangrovivirga halotolerans TaxID=2993936 RepID=A0ABT3RVS8_9BACT|nr:hypothetical protein [Mangrovivirga halotolerans]MCX2745879.1 hypothetical protein [Mangrovivirga halotolerans]